MTAGRRRSGSSRSPRASASRAGVLDGELEPLAADLRLELVGRALGDDPAVVDDDDLVGQQVGLLEVLGGQQQRRPARDEALDDLPHLGAAARVQTGGRLVEEQDRRVGHERAGEVEPAAHAARVGLARAGRPASSSRNAASSSRARSRERLRAQVVEPADHVEVLEARQVLVDGGVLARQPDACGARPAAGSSTSMPATSAEPLSGCRSVVRMRTMVVLPAPLGPSRPSTDPVGTVEIDAVEGRDVLVPLDQPRGDGRDRVLEVM